MLNFVIKSTLIVKNKIFSELKEIRKNYDKRLYSQTSLYSKNNLNRQEGLALLNKILLQEKLDLYSENIGMFSEHLIMFAAIACNKKNKIDSILEIGTFNGITSILLSKIFPNAEIITIDLNDNDPIFKKIYDRENDLKRKRFIEDRNLRLSKIKNIKFIQINSLEITINSLQKDNFDLIWIDGAHGYPYVCSDITNAIRLSHAQTILMCDDIWKNLKNSDSMYSSIAAFETLEEFYKAGIIETDYFYKRLAKKYLSSEKFISLSKLKI